MITNKKKDEREKCKGEDWTEKKRYMKRRTLGNFTSMRAS